MTVTGRDAWGTPGAQSDEIEFLARNDGEWQCFVVLLKRGICVLASNV